jgi:hypothetical protein
LGLSPVGDSASLPVRPALLLPWEDVRVGCSAEPFLRSQKKTTASGESQDLRNHTKAGKAE